MIEFSFTCPHCWEMQLKLIDSSVNFHSFIEDCEVCCNPISFELKIYNNSISHSQVELIE
jgi:hypothetical protein|tara:strand:- start:1418 stop:1597 length:180 start_codon:yes stop_codon:yes gene_type:complete